MAAFVTLSAALIVAPHEATATETGESDWVIYAEAANGDLHFYDPSRVERVDMVRRVWTRVRYKTSVMGASGFRSLLEIDCAGGTGKALQSTFFTDRNWEKPAMKTDTSEKQKRRIVPGSATGRLTEVVCDN
ncbi:hypothetical protein G3256_16190 [Roseobacter ponti]|uniref:Surface-adhesin protein E-like domain-containing protein n=1 Tax=Roseobacter ponti TaxID=1891787 RepID=A0A858SWE1_9RHOB|nr:hypothetical protein G3256_16190 [Roseobacter ponti]